MTSEPHEGLQAVGRMMWFRISVTISSDAECRTLISEPPPKPSETLRESGFRTKQAGLRFTTEGASIQFELHLSAGFAAVFVGICVCVCVFVGELYLKPDTVTYVQ